MAKRWKQYKSTDKKGGVIRLLFFPIKSRYRGQISFHLFRRFNNQLNIIHFTAGKYQHTLMCSHHISKIAVGFGLFILSGNFSSVSTMLRQRNAGNQIPQRQYAFCRQYPTSLCFFHNKVQPVRRQTQCTTIFYVVALYGCRRFSRVVCVSLIVGTHNVANAKKFVPYQNINHCTKKYKRHSLQKSSAGNSAKGCKHKSYCSAEKKGQYSGLRRSVFLFWLMNHGIYFLSCKIPLTEKPPQQPIGAQAVYHYASFLAMTCLPS